MSNLDNGKRTTITVSVDTLNKLKRLQGFLQQQDGKRRNMDEVIQVLMKNAEFVVSVYKEVKL
jgi:hypothetical protein